MKAELIDLLEQLSDSDFGKVKQLYAMQGIKGDTRQIFVDNTPDKVVPGMIKLCKKQLGQE